MWKQGAVGQEYTFSSDTWYLQPHSRGRRIIKDLLCIYCMVSTDLLFFVNDTPEWPQMHTAESTDSESMPSGRGGQVNNHPVGVALVPILLG